MTWLGFFLGMFSPKYLIGWVGHCCIVDSNNAIYVNRFTLRLMSGANFFMLSLHLVFLTSQGQTTVLDGLAFWSFSGIERGYSHVD
ncbi:MAG: hypothetical protein AB2693_11645 [Candidatus Thiodiazotropha sp.]